MPLKCYFCWNDIVGSWERIEKSANDPRKTWVGKDEGNDRSDVKTLFCLSAGDTHRTEECETNGKILLSMIKNKSRSWVGVAIELIPSPNTLI